MHVHVMCCSGCKPRRDMCFACCTAHCHAWTEVSRQRAGQVQIIIMEDPLDVDAHIWCTPSMMSMECELSLHVRQ